MRTNQLSRLGQTGQLKIMQVQLPSDYPTNQLIKVGPHDCPTVVLGYGKLDVWRVPTGQTGTFISYRRIWPFNKRLRWSRVD